MFGAYPAGTAPSGSSVSGAVMRVSGIFGLAQRVCAGAALLLLPGLAQAQAADGVPDAIGVTDSGDTAFVIAMALLGLAMILPGIALHHGARLRARAFGATATQVGAIAAVVTLLWVMVGYTLGFGNVTSGWLGSGNAWMLNDLGNVRGASAVPEVAFVLLQLGFAILAAALLTGAWAERGNIAWAVPFAGLWSLIVYAPVAHWVWGGGWLATRLGTVDFGGALVVHTSAGISALVITLLIGRRARADDAHGGSSGLAFAGTGMVWAALLALTAGATLAASDDAATALVNAQLAAAAGALVWLLADAITGGKAHGFALARGALAGIVASSAAVNAIAPGSAMVAGLVGAVVAWLAARLIRYSGIDDAVDLVAVHGIAGLAGALLAAPLIAGTLGGTGYAPGMTPMRQVVAQAIGAGVIAGWAAIGTAIVALMVAMVVPMRISEAEETA
ncbi:ammonium transporter [Novosphingobium sp.]|uniref:ammonium transporter n=1 Tax=Novosphingobium sp. TaxID=1874826 RepID=UPI003B5296A1